MEAKDIPDVQLKELIETVPVWRKEARQKVLVLDRFPRAGGRLMSYKDYPEKGWTVDVGLHMIELGEKSGCAELNRPVGREIEWATNSAARSAMECANLILENRKFYT